MADQDRNVWTCKVGWAGDELPHGADYPMRQAVNDRYIELTGHDPDFIFSGWGGALTEPELAVIEDRLPSDEYEAQWRYERALQERGGDLLYTAWAIIANANGGDWASADPEWREAAERWRDDFHTLLPPSLPIEENQ